MGVPLQLYVFEYDEKCGRKWYEGLSSDVLANFTLLYGDQANPLDLKRATEAIGSPVDAIIDDGGHTYVFLYVAVPALTPARSYAQQIISLKTLFVSILKPGGLYFLEDTITHFFMSRSKKPDYNQSTIDYLADTISDVTRKLDITVLLVGKKTESKNPETAGQVFRVDAWPAMYVLTKISVEKQAMVKAKLLAGIAGNSKKGR